MVAFQSSCPVYEANTPIEVRLSVVSARLMVGSPTLVLKPTGTRAPSSGCWGERMPSLPSHEMTATSVRQAIAHKLTAVSGKILFIAFWFFLFFSCSCPGGDIQPRPGCLFFCRHPKDNFLLEILTLG
ncbi:hypothetical protein NXV57_32215 [Bacteroides thetaiotaomicron]|nr:hypothetical protein [Bacteroides thetaiotaomicron]